MTKTAHKRSNFSPRKPQLFMPTGTVSCLWAFFADQLLRRISAKMRRFERNRRGELSFPLLETNGQFQTHTSWNEELSSGFSEESNPAAVRLPEVVYR